MSRLLLVSVFLVATCGLVYELLASTVASYLLGDSVLQFSTVIGTYLSAMGVGSYLARYLVGGLMTWFVQIQVWIGLLGGCSSAGLFLLYGHTSAGGFRLALYLLVFLIGALVGMEIPLLLRILKDRREFRDLVSEVLALDYVGALAASLLFPLVLVPQLGLIRTAFLFGLINVAVALAFLHGRGGGQPGRLPLQLQAWLAAALLLLGLAAADRLTLLSEESLYPDPILLTRTTPYQRLVVTRRAQDVRLYLNNNLQFSTEDEYRYHEALVHPVLGAARDPARLLVLGGGDGLAARQALMDPRVERLTLVDLDPEMTRLFSEHPLLVGINGGVLRDPRVTIVNRDAFQWLEQAEGRYDGIVVDFPDPSSFSVGKLYTTTFYRALKERLAPGGAISVQSTSPRFARRSFWCIVETIRSVGLSVRPYHAYVPSFGEWGFVLAAPGPLPLPRLERQGLRFLTPPVLASLFEFPPDLGPVPVEVNRLQNQALVRYYDQDWREIVE